MAIIDFIAGITRYIYYLLHRETAHYLFTRQVLQRITSQAEISPAQQFEYVKAIVQHAYTYSPFYRRRFIAQGFKPEDFNDISDLQQLPVLSKADLRDNIDEILCTNIVPEDRIQSATGGTTGIPVTFYRDRYSQQYRRGIDIAIARYYGWHTGQWQGLLWGAPRDLISARNIKEKILQHFVYRQYALDTSQLTNESYEQFVRQTLKYNTRFILAYPSLAYDLAKRIQAGVVSPVRVPVISVTAEPLHDFQRAAIENVLAENVYARYGAREFGTAAFECREKQGMHILTESVYFEVIPTSPGSDIGTLLVTDLLNRTMPLIRYRVGDIARLDFSPCPCGLPTPRLCDVSGRETDIIWRPDGSGLPGTEIVSMVGRSGIKVKVQVIQEQERLIVIKVEGMIDSNKNEIESLIHIFRKDISADIEYRVESVERIKRTPSGKYRYVISNIPQPIISD